MRKIFIGGSRRISRLPSEVKNRLDGVVENGHQVLVGDANGADKAVQKYFLQKEYRNLLVYCTSDPRNNLGEWQTRVMSPSRDQKGYHHFAVKDRAMARDADFGLMIWDGKSAGTILNVLRLLRNGKIAVLFSNIDKKTINLKKIDDWNEFLKKCDQNFVSEIRGRATVDEWGIDNQTELLI